MELKRWNPVNNELGGCDIKQLFNGNFVLYDDALAYAEERVKEATRWIDYKICCPNNNRVILLKINNKNTGGILVITGRFFGGLNKPETKDFRILTGLITPEREFYLFEELIAWKEIE